jgi:FkbM family methyltransferase
MKTFIQIGTHNGDDEFNKLVKKENPDLVILVEPNNNLNEEIIENYSSIIDRVHIENIAINTKSGPCEVVIPKNPLPLSDGNYCELGTGHYSLLPMDDWGDDFKSIKVNGMTFSDLCEKYSIDEIDYLQTDTEGFDSQIILSIDFDKIKIKKLQYEYWPFKSEDQYTRYGKEGEKYGINGMEEVESKLTSLGYKLSYCPEDVIATLK